MTYRFDPHSIRKEVSVPLLDTEGLAAELATTERHIRHLVQKRVVPFVKVGGLVRFRPEEIEAWLDSSRPVQVEPPESERSL